jgi:2-dehydropantoate 2-reductase
MNTSEVLESKEAMSAVKSLMDEVISAANAEGYNFDKEQQMKEMISATKATAKNYKPSM